MFEINVTPAVGVVLASAKATVLVFGICGFDKEVFFAPKHKPIVHDSWPTNVSAQRATNTSGPETPFRSFRSSITRNPRHHFFWRTHPASPERLPTNRREKPPFSIKIRTHRP
ncbi:hypothetical protein J3458_018934 [Metarhizium acridum]|uniref:uncharacterized protein n=1 Tax=Metarhizium acridum TaxID=92637 RepID=UPI001C6B090D|nr:hypothetical protein J3458_018934 [Metarhizium acridum]